MKTTPHRSHLRASKVSVTIFPNAKVVGTYSWPRKKQRSLLMRRVVIVTAPLVRAVYWQKLEAGGLR
jgi:hypothetical protein